MVYPSGRNQNRVWLYPFPNLELERTYVLPEMSNLMTESARETTRRIPIQCSLEAQLTKQVKRKPDTKRHEGKETISLNVSNPSPSTSITGNRPQCFRLYLL